MSINLQNNFLYKKPHPRPFLDGVILYFDSFTNRTVLNNILIILQLKLIQFQKSNFSLPMDDSRQDKQYHL